MKLVMGGLAAAMLLAFAVGTASARRFQVSEQRFYVIWSSLEFEGGLFIPVKCPVTLLGSFHSRTISKVSGQLIGHITHVDVREASCTNGSATALKETLPWHVQYNSFAGGLPAITSVRVALVGAKFLVEIPGVIACLYTTTQERPAFGAITISGGDATTLAASGEISGIRLPESPNACPTGRFQGSGNVRAGSEPSTTRIRVTLVQ
jgi:hypothetical protein